MHIALKARNEEKKRTSVGRIAAAIAVAHSITGTDWHRMLSWMDMGKLGPPRYCVGGSDTVLVYMGVSRHTYCMHNAHAM